MNVALLCVLFTEMTMIKLTIRVYAQPSNTNFSQMALIFCPENCTSCNQTYCFKCKTGYKGDMCELLCSNCGPVTKCDKNTGYCLERCRDGLSGYFCTETCNSRCMSCDRLRNNKCVACATGWYGTLCNGKCSQGCLNNTCNRSDGVCTLGCSAGYWGHKCEQQCVQCEDNICDTTNGVCLNGCEDGKNEMNCSTSANQNNLDGQFQTTLSSCPDNCTSCNQTYCFACKPGYKGDTCELLCSNCGPATVCDKISGYCLERCVDGLSGYFCNETCDSNCISCNRIVKERCISCAFGRHGIWCNDICSKGCLRNECHDLYGTCTLGCSAGYWGHYCKEECANCKDDICDNTTGLCLNGCADGRHGMNCSTSGNQQTNLRGHLTLTASSIGLVLGQGLVVLACVIFVIATICAKRHSIRSCLRCSD